MEKEKSRKSGNGTAKKTVEVEMNKSVTAGTHFNARVVECRLAAKVLAKVSSLDWKKVCRLSEVQEEILKTLEEM
ncbi:N-acetylgalactosamine kinase [Acropora cervicornis]|uniref:N-acetylgalactosamine kinase n=1 Tax=Acropora cervicornis TaxID=6130 RepID=A0AAD9V8T3_ACRCE|nr:N-acetylgalactosamine kinase [Acropora cervicornis]